jgi:hypothetical protein
MKMILVPFPLNAQLKGVRAWFGLSENCLWLSLWVRQNWREIIFSFYFSNLFEALPNRQMTSTKNLHIDSS